MCPLLFLDESVGAGIGGGVENASSFGTISEAVHTTCPLATPRTGRYGVLTKVSPGPAIVGWHPCW